jgi:hypothetical protein
MVVTKESRDLMAKILNVGDIANETNPRQGMKTTSVSGYPVILCWARWGGSEINASGKNKAFVFLPYLQSGQMPLTKYNGATSVETPLDMVVSGVPNPYNCKVSVTPSLNISKLIEGEYYSFVLALRPAAVGRGSSPTPDWDGWIKTVGPTPNDVFKDYFGLFNVTRNQRLKNKVFRDEEGEEPEHDSPEHHVQQ